MVDTFLVNLRKLRRKRGRANKLKIPGNILVRTGNWRDNNKFIISESAISRANAAGTSLSLNGRISSKLFIMSVD